MTSGRPQFDSPVRVLITGGAGFLGRALVRELTAPRGEPVLRAAHIRLFDRAVPDHGPGEVAFVRGDIRDGAALERACQDVDVVFHTAALVSWGQHPDALVHEVNVGGTRRVIEACARAGVPALVHTSTLDVVYDGRPVREGDERLPYPRRYYNAYAETKALSEQAALAADGSRHADGAGRLRSCALRPCGMWGERDPFHISNLLRMARAGKLLFRMGNGRARFQHVYVGNVAHAHLLAARSLLAAGAACGQVYLITDFPPSNFFSYYAPILEALGHPLPPAWRSLPYPLMLGVAGALEGVQRLSRPFFRFAPTVNRFAVKQVCQEFTFSGAKAGRDLGYRPVYPESEAIERTIDDFRRCGPV